MKKIILCIVTAGVVLAGCTSKEQDKKIQAFWQQQGTNAARKWVAKNPALWGKILPDSLTAKPAPVTYTSTFPRNPVAATPQRRPAAPRKPAPEVQVLDISMDEEAFPGKAPYDERVRIKQAWSNTQVNNQNALRDIQTAFGSEVREKAFYITVETERKLKQEATTVANYKTYLARQTEILAEQDEAIKKLMEQNKGSLRSVRKSANPR